MGIVKKLYIFFVDTIQSFLIAGSIFLVIYVFFFRPFQVNGSSMFPNFENEEYILTNLIDLRLHALRQGDIVVFKAPTEPDKDFIKRIIGVPGDNVSVNDGNVYVNGKLLNERAYLDPNVKTYGSLQFLNNGQTKTVPQDEYFVLGDNRGNSSDSRVWGFVRKDAIIGKSFFVYWPVNHMRVINNPFE